MSVEKLIELMSHFDEAETERFRRFVKSAFFNEKPVNDVLLEWFVKKCNEQKTSNPSKQKRGSSSKELAVYLRKKEQSANPTLITRRTKELILLWEEFAGISEFVSNSRKISLSRMKYFRKAGLNDNFKKEYELLSHSLASDPLDHVTTELKFELETENLHFHVNRQRLANPALQKLNKIFNEYYSLTFWKVTAVNFMENAIKKTDEVIYPGENVPGTDMEGSVGVLARAYQQIYEIFARILKSRSNSEEKPETDLELRYQKFKLALNQLIPELSTTEQHDLFTSAINICVQFIGMQKYAYRHEILELYEQALKTKGLTDNSGYFPVGHFKNYVSVALGSGEREKAIRFNNMNKKLLNPEYQEMAWNLNLALVSYYDGNYLLASTQVKNCIDGDIADPFLLWFAKGLHLKCIYYLGLSGDEAKSLEDVVVSNKAQLWREKRISSVEKNAWNKFFDFILALWKYQGSSTTKKLKQNLECLKGGLFVKESEWLLAEYQSATK